jgi:heme-degrading monooxygenase HmoA
MYFIIWEYRVKAEHESDFTSVYSEHGDWVQLFRKSPGYIGTELLHDQTKKDRYLTIDRWESTEAYDAFRLSSDREYRTLDRKCSNWTEEESALGCFLGVLPRISDKAF